MLLFVVILILKFFLALLCLVVVCGLPIGSKNLFCLQSLYKIHFSTICHYPDLSFQVAVQQLYPVPLSFMSQPSAQPSYANGFYPASSCPASSDPSALYPASLGCTTPPAYCGPQQVCTLT